MNVEFLEKLKGILYFLEKKKNDKENLMADDT